VEPMADLRRPARVAVDVGPRRVAAGRTAAGEQALLEQARALNAAHWQAHGRQISRDKLRAALGIGATRAERLLAALTAERPTNSPPAADLELAPAGAAGAARPGQWAALRAQPADGSQGDGHRG
jgi:hypothetical protein